jgi:hypothetical protein
MSRTAADTDEAYIELHRMLRDRFGDVRSLSPVANMDAARFERLNEIYKIARTIDCLPRAERLLLNRMGRNHLAIAQCSEEVWRTLVGLTVVNGKDVASDGVVTVSDLDVR